MLSGQRLGRYWLLESLKSGGMATVYSATEQETGRVVAVKVLSPILATDPAYVARFKNEVAQVRKLAHPNIVPIEYFGVEGPYTYFVMPLFKASLRDALLRHKRLSPSFALNVAIQIASALTAVHSLGLIHRDIKPDNILLSDDRALLTDFGIVRQVEFSGAGQPPTLAGSGLPIGTPQYMAPEQLSGQHVDHRADIYALGAVLYEMLTGRPPHIANTPYSMASRALTDPIRPPATLNPAVSAELDAVVMRSLARDPRDRYASAADMRAALQSVQEQPWRDMPISGGRPNQHDMRAASNFPPRSTMDPALPRFHGPSNSAQTEEPGALEIKAALMGTGMGALEGMKTVMGQRATMTVMGQRATMTGAGVPSVGCSSRWRRCWLLSRWSVVSTWR